MKIVVIGASFAGLACALEARHLYPKAEIVVLEAGQNTAYIPNGLHWKLRGRIDELKEALWQPFDDWAAAGLDLRLGHRVTRINPASKTLQVDRQGQVQEITYDKLVLAMGSSPRSDYIKGSNAHGVLTIKDLEHSQQAVGILERAQKVAIVGGGPIGIEASETCLRLGKQVSLYEAGPHLDFKHCDRDFVAPLEEKMQAAGLDLHLQERVEELVSHGTAGLVVQTSKGQQAVDAVILGVNFRANSQLLEGLCDLELDGTVRVNDYLQTSQPDIFAVGDLAHLSHLQEATYQPLINTALRTGRLAAFNLLAPHLAFPARVRLVGFQHFGLYRLSVGMTEEEAGFQMEVRVTKVCKQGLTLKLVWQAKTGQLLGLQCLSEQNGLLLGNLAALSIRKQVTDEELAMQEFLFAPYEDSFGLALHEGALAAMKERVWGCY